MTHVKDFELSLALLSASSQLSDLEPLEPTENNPMLSLVLGYMYCLLRYGATIVIPRLEVVLQQFFPGLCKKISAPESKSCMMITEVDLADPEPVLREGDLLMPVYCSGSSTLLYNIHRVDAEVADYSLPACRGGLNFFNCVVRASSVGSTRILWKDPVVMSTRLQSASYDRMFALAIADRYLKSFREEYPIVSQPLTTLAMAIRFIDLVEIETDKKKEIVLREVPDLSVLQVSGKEIPATISSPSLAIDQEKRDITSLLLYLKLYHGESNPNILLTGFKSYAFLRTISKMYIKGKFTVYEKLATTVLSKTLVVMPNNVYAINRVLSSSDLAKASADMIVFSCLKSNDRLLRNFSGTVVVAEGSTSFLPDVTYCSCFTSGSEAVAFSVIRERVQVTPEDVLLTTIRTRQFIRDVDVSFRDTRRWKYGALPGTIFDEAILAQLTAP